MLKSDFGDLNISSKQECAWKPARGWPCSLCGAYASQRLNEK